MRFTTLVAMLLFPISIHAVDLACTVPSTFVTRGSELCEILRTQMAVRSVDWSNDECATELLRRGLRDFEASVTRNIARDLVTDDVREATSFFDANFPIQAVIAVCGDGIADLEFNEQCDPPDGVTCDEQCQTIP